MEGPHGAATSSASPEASLKITWVPPSGLMSLSLANALLRMVTLGIYNFWGKTEVRKRIWSAVRLDGEPLSYTGTGKELFLGFLIVFVVVILPLMLATFAAVFAFGPESPMVGVVQMLLYVIIFFLTGIAIYRAQRYRLSRTRWRGIRGSLTGSDKSYAWAYFWTALLIPITWGWILPWRTTTLQQIMTRDTKFGDRPFRFDAKPGPLYGRFAMFWCGTAFIALAAFGVLAGTLGKFMGGDTVAGIADEPNAMDPSKIIEIIAIVYGVLAVAFLFYYVLSAWYRARQINHFAAHTHFEGATLKSTVTGGGLVWVALGNFLLTMLGWALGFGLFLGIVLLSTTINLADPQSAISSHQDTATRVAAILGLLVLTAFSGLFSPFVQARNARYLVDNLSLLGQIDLAKVAQGADQGITRGEGLAQAFDVDAF